MLQSIGSLFCVPPVLRLQFSFSRLLASQRCVVLLEGFYEWKSEPGEGGVYVLWRGQRCVENCVCVNVCVCVCWCVFVLGGAAVSHGLTCVVLLGGFFE